MSTPTPSSERRAAMVAGIRALADLIESDTTLPVPDSVHAQHSLPGSLDEPGRQLIRNVAAHLGIDPAAPQWGSSHLIDEPGRVAVRVQVAGGYTPQVGSYRVDYIIYGRVASAGDVS